MRQQRWLELVKDYDCTILYHPGKANVVTDALSRKNMGPLSALCIRQDHLIRDFENLRIEILSSPVRTSAILASFIVKPTIRDRIVAAQRNDPFLEKIRVEVGTEKRKGFEIAEDKAMMFKGRLCVPKDEVLKDEIMTEAHFAPYAAHPGGIKMYKDLRDTFWWRNMKGKIALFVSKCMVCQQVKAEHHRPLGSLNPIDIPEWKWEKIAMDFVVGFLDQREVMMRSG